MLQEKLNNNQNHMIGMKELAERLNIKIAKLYSLIDVEDDSRSILKGTVKIGDKRVISTKRVDELFDEIQERGGIDNATSGI